MCSWTRRCRARNGRPGRSSCAATKSSLCRGSSRLRESRLSAFQTEVERGVAEILIEEESLRERIAELGAEISADYAGKDLLLIGVLKGAVFFMADLMRQITVPCEVDFMAISSYGASTDSSGVVRILKDLDESIEGRNVLVVEDIIDSGLTLSYLKRTLGARQPASLEVCALLTKPERREVDVPVRYIGFEIPNRFVVGYGLDFAERYRNLRYVGVLADEAAADIH
jgi:hypoxanthine phosphoribosyltransferase